MAQCENCNQEMEVDDTFCNLCGFVKEDNNWNNRLLVTDEIDENVFFNHTD